MSKDSSEFECDRVRYISSKGEFVLCNGKLRDQYVDKGDGRFPTHRICLTCGKDFGEVSLFISPLNLAISRRQQLFGF